MNTNVLIAPNAFKHSLSATAVANAIQRGFEIAQWKGELKCLPIGDGGTGTGELLCNALNATTIKTPVENLLGVIEIVNWGWCEEKKLAIIDLATTNGIDRIQPNQYDPLHFTTYGTGQLIKSALEKNAKEILLCVGGSATIDGGIGIAQALGVKFFSHKGIEIQYPKELNQLSDIDFTGVNKLIQHCDIKVLCDVQTPFLGEKNAIEIYGKQKGATIDIQEHLLKSFKRYNQVLGNLGYGNLIDLPYGGAAGGAAGGLKLLFKAQLLNGFETFYEYVEIEKILPDFQILITGEGKLDHQTLEGKGPFAIAKKARNFNINVIAIAGTIEEHFKTNDSPFDKVYDIVSKFNNGNDFSKTKEFLTELSNNIAIDLKDHLWKH